MYIHNMYVQRFSCTTALISSHFISYIHRIPQVHLRRQFQLTTPPAHRVMSRSRERALRSAVRIDGDRLGDVRLEEFGESGGRAQGKSHVTLDNPVPWLRLTTNPSLESRPALTGR